MHTVNDTQITTRTSTSHEVRAESTAFAQRQRLPWVPITGNTIPIRRLLWTLGGTYDRHLRQWSVPQHRASEAQAIADRFTRRSPRTASATPPLTPPTPVMTLSVPTQEPAPVPSVESMSDIDVLALLLGQPVAAPLTQVLRRQIEARGLRRLLAEGPQSLQRSGCDPAAALRIAAAIDLPNRLWRSPHQEAPALSTPGAIAAWIGPRLAALTCEEFWCIPLGPTCRVVGEARMITRGDVDGTDAGPRALLRHALSAGAVSCVAVHNHPSGDPTPSAADLTVTARLCAAGRAIDLQVVDHLVIGSSGRFCSIRRDRPECFRENTH